MPHKDSRDKDSENHDQYHNPNYDIAKMLLLVYLANIPLALLTMAITLTIHGALHGQYSQLIKSIGEHPLEVAYRWLSGYRLLLVVSFIISLLLTILSGERENLRIISAIFTLTYSAYVFYLIRWWICDMFNILKLHSLQLKQIQQFFNDFIGTMAADTLISLSYIFWVLYLHDKRSRSCRFCRFLKIFEYFCTFSSIILIAIIYLDLRFFIAFVCKLFL